MTSLEYKTICACRWNGAALRDALSHWQCWEDMRTTLFEAMREFHGNPFQKDLNGKCHNPDGTLTEFLWKLQTVLGPDRSCLYPLLDFEEHFQKCFLRRGLIIYCTGLLREIETPKPEPEGQLAFL